MAASVRQRLLNLAKERGEDFNFVLLRFGLDGSDQAEDPVPDHTPR